MSCVSLFFVLEVGGVALVETNCENKAEWRRGSGARALSIADLRRLQEPFHMVITLGSAGSRP